MAVLPFEFGAVPVQARSGAVGALEVGGPVQWCHPLSDPGWYSAGGPVEKPAAVRRAVLGVEESPA